MLISDADVQMVRDVIGQDFSDALIRGARLLLPVMSIALKTIL